MILPGTIPNILGVSLSGTNLVLNASNGFSGGAYDVLMSTNLGQSLSQWIAVATNILGGSPNFTLTATNAVNLNASQQFYILQLQ